MWTGAGDVGTGAAGPTGTGMLEDASNGDCVELVQYKSKSYIDTLLVVHFEGCKCYFVPLWLCTDDGCRSGCWWWW